ncbi:pimeloyl-ACP methyl ester carboxylesterase [Novosphingobium kunmingense]|uniref:Pimeloyl-ACP methyl ester carboxylesterase n=1 Tax=Novosphingobium kunmingense TaxID=1211806 RepID=A0A2N0I346_9SPHN|nr:alpha/beta hydrolase [Novosphingobium kunmingense]PKB25607.1 pimeloyl-ACP methyl ester carboxylesterase [Novosphingobium kunmingense]
MTIHGPTSNSFISQRLRLHYVDWGSPDKPPLILQHGGRDHARSWDWVAEELARDWHVIAPDLRGHGDSAWAPDGNYDMNAYVYDFAQLVHTLGHDQVTIVSHSLGGNVATRFTGLYPEKVRKLVNIEGLGPSPKVRAEREAAGYPNRFRKWIEDRRAASGRVPRRYPTIEAAFARMKEENSFLTDEQARHLTIHGASRNEDGTWSWKFDPYLNVWPFEDAPEERTNELWSAITCPILFLYGADSWASNPETDGRAMKFKNYRVIEFENAGHWLHHDQFDRFMREVRAFL